MNTQNVLLAVELLIQLTEAAARVGALIQRAQSEGRDLSETELQSLKQEDDLARERLLQAVEQAEAAEAAQKSGG